jgi:hypothetical protein
MNRRERRRYEKEQKKKGIRKLDWNKLFKVFWGLFLIMIMPLILLITSFSYYDVTKKNNLRNIIAEAPRSTYATVLSIRSRSYTAEYEFTARGIKYKDRTHKTFKGKIGDEICIEYYSKDPKYNMECSEKEIQSIKEDVVISSLKMLVFMVIVQIVTFFYFIVTGNKKFMADVTTK